MTDITVSGDGTTDGQFRAYEAALALAREERDVARNGLRAIRNHWNEFGPANGFEETIEQACTPIQINSDADTAPWTGLARAIQIVENHTCSDFCACKYEILRDLELASSAEPDKRG